jgi:hypothetical protein
MENVERGGAHAVMHCSLKNRFTFSHSILARELVSQLAHMGFHNGLSELGIQVTSINHHL